ncbi:oxidoreductase [Spizellomyces punctatus DAOM BR117]|uniref:Oxidoreductase n=1 Tax=Spizellomyces punctatus (strain DAOM BR117) TaxID=645134 RepID=A0A0L0H422_SPIPD|nr:oxidoreductase [Spizellomyces punctatus DAOM BR117]KNC96235.1 oxidoreductase [Spizellomyces punctatus DAOM BR117]|eukprot:XP_016604275.1 oxidoreductase [Spizellomyces punctatus DAOM BR117]
MPPPVPFHHPVIRGMTFCPRLLPQSLLDTLLEHIDEEQWFDPLNGRNQVMRFGNLPPWLSQLVKISRDLLPNKLRERDPAFDQMIANYYDPGQGLRHHVDLVRRFDDGIVIASLAGSCVMEYRPAENKAEDMCSHILPSHDSVKSEQTHCQQTRNSVQNSKVAAKCPLLGEATQSTTIPILLSPGDVVCLSGPARWEWEHGIPERLEDEWENKRIPRGTRISITLRKLLPDALLMPCDG